jgi:hypothetical protein
MRQSRLEGRVDVGPREERRILPPSYRSSTAVAELPSAFWGILKSPGLSPRAHVPHPSCSGRRAHSNNYTHIWTHPPHLIRVVSAPS